MKNAASLPLALPCSVLLNTRRQAAGAGIARAARQTMTAPKMGGSRATTISGKP